MSLHRRGHRAADLLHRPGRGRRPHGAGARHRGRDRHGRDDGLECRADPCAGPVRGGHAAQEPGRDVRLRDERRRAGQHHRDALRQRHRRARPLPPGQGEARGAARDARLPGGELDVPRPVQPGQRRRPGVRHGRARREHRPDQEAQGRHRRAHPAPGRPSTPRPAASSGSRPRSPRSSSPTAASPASCWTAANGSRRPSVVSAVAPGPDPQHAGQRRGRGRRPQHPPVRDRPPRQLRPDALRARRRAGVRGAVRVPQRPEDAERDRALRHAGGPAAPVRGQPARHRPGRRRPSRSRSRPRPTPTSRRPARPRPRRSRCGSRSRRTRPSTPGSRRRWGSG